MVNTSFLENLASVGKALLSRYAMIEAYSSSSHCKFCHSLVGASAPSVIGSASSLAIR